MSYTTLVDVATLKANLANPDWRIVDVRHLLADVTHGERAYAESHLPGAVFLHCDRDLLTTMTGTELVATLCPRLRFLPSSWEKLASARRLRWWSMTIRAA